MHCFVEDLRTRTYITRTQLSLCTRRNVTSAHSSQHICHPNSTPKKRFSEIIISISKPFPIPSLKPTPLKLLCNGPHSRSTTRSYSTKTHFAQHQTLRAPLRERTQWFELVSRLPHRLTPAFSRYRVVKVLSTTTAQVPFHPHSLLHLGFELPPPPSLQGIVW